MTKDPKGYKYQVAVEQCKASITSICDDLGCTYVQDSFELIDPGDKPHYYIWQADGEASLLFGDYKVNLVVRYHDNNYGSSYKYPKIPGRIAILVNNGFKLKGFIKAELNQTAVSLSFCGLYATKDKFKIAFSDGDQFSLYIKHSGLKHYRLHKGFYDLEQVIKDAVDTKLPQPFHFVNELIADSKNMYGYCGNIADPPVGKAVWCQRTNQLHKAAFVGVYQLTPDGCLSADTNSPSHKNLWFVVTTSTYESVTLNLAVKDDDWYLISGNKYLMIDSGCTAVLTVDDQKLIEEAIRRGVNKE